MMSFSFVHKYFGANISKSMFLIASKKKEILSATSTLRYGQMQIPQLYSLAIFIIEKNKRIMKEAIYRSNKIYKQIKDSDTFLQLLYII